MRYEHELAMEKVKQQEQSHKQQKDMNISSKVLELPIFRDGIVAPSNPTQIRLMSRTVFIETHVWVQWLGTS